VCSTVCAAPRIDLHGAGGRRVSSSMQRWIVVAVAVILWHPAAGQAPAFEVASVKASQSTTKANVEVTPGGVRIDGSLNYILGWAYDLKKYQVSGPGWIGSERYRIAAKPAATASPAELKRMMQRLVAERFQLASHRETREFPVYALVVAKGGPKLKESSSKGEAATTNNRKLGSGGTSVRTSLAQLADLLDGCCSDPVVDRTGLTRRYDFALDISAYMPIQQSGDLPVILNEAMQKQLGIGMEHRKVTIEVLVVDHAEKVPVEN
jgi:uncharacterized protein (TIGR03435 family)